MLLKKNEKNKLMLAVTVVILGILVWGILAINQQKTDRSPALPESQKKKDSNMVDQPGTDSSVVKKKIVVQPKIDYKDLEVNEPLKDMMAGRKEQLGLKNSLDMIVNSDETFTVGDVQIAMSDILKQAFIKQGEVFEENIEGSGEIRPHKIRQYGIYVIQPGDNIWNIHFNILKEYYEHQGIEVEPKADEPVNHGMSSGVGKILKFSETMVIIYNLIEKKVDVNIDLLEPLSKIVVYNMAEVFSLLQEINYENIDRIQFDGKTIWIPSEKN